MIKIVEPRGWDFDRPIAVMLKMSSRGLVGQDRRDFIKTAGHAFLETIDNVKFAADELPVHLIALGTDSFWGPNRNGDSFPETTCREQHDTFRKFARFYRNHQNRDTKKSYGVIKASVFNETMKRVELLVGLNTNKEAADRNEGLVADKEIEKLSRDEDIPVSMAAMVPYDVCSNCGNRAKDRSEYCTEEKCVSKGGHRRGGCRNNLTKTAEDGHILHVSNPVAKWFDISNVIRCADRTAYASQADWFNKAANDQFMPGAELAEMLGITAPSAFFLTDAPPASASDAVHCQFKLAQAMAAMETNHNYLGFEKSASAFDPQLYPEWTENDFALLGTPGTPKAASALGALADEKIILPLPLFARWLKKESLAAEAAGILPGLHARLLESGQLAIKLASNPFTLDRAVLAPYPMRSFARKLAAEMALDAETVKTAVMRGAIRGCGPRDLKNVFGIESSVPEAFKLAEDYTLYKLASLQRIAAFDNAFHLTTALALVQNKS